MTLRRRHQLAAIAVPIVLGVAMLVAAPWLLPSTTEIAGVDSRLRPPAAPVTALPAPTPSPVEPSPVAASPTPTPPSLAQRIATDDAAALSALTDRLLASGAAVSSAGVAYDLVAAGRPQVALAYLAARPDGKTPATWRLRFDQSRATGDSAAALALLTAAASARTGVAAADIVAAGYAMSRPDLIVRAATVGAIPPLDARLTLDLVRRYEAGGRVADIAAIDRIAKSDWRTADPWLALRIANRTGDKAAALRAAALLPPRDRAAAEQQILARSGDRAGLLASLRREAVQPGVDKAAIAERLLDAGDRAGAIAALQSAAATQPPTSPASRRLLYLMGPRPEAASVAWLRRRATSGSGQSQRDWLLPYADRDTPREALATLSRHPLAARTDVLLLRLRLAHAASDEDAGRTALAQLLDGRSLEAAELRQIAATTPRTLSPALSAALSRRRADAGLIGLQERMDLAWGRWNRGDAAGTVAALRPYLADRPNDVAALRLMGEAQSRLSGADAARPWFERALARSDSPSRASVELLERLGRRAEALRMVADLRAGAPRDRALAALHARLLIAQGEPGRARTVLAQ